MKSGEGGTFWKPGKTLDDRRPGRYRYFVLLPFFLLYLTGTGCVGPSKRANVEKHLMSNKSPEQRHQEVVNSYQTACPDVVHVSIVERPQVNGNYAIGPDGRIKLAGLDPIRIEGHTMPEIAARLAAAVKVPPRSVAVEVVEFNSQHVLLIGEVAGSQQVHSYQGQETVLELLQRIGGITRGAAPDSVYVVRSHVENGLRPEIIHVDLAGIVEKKDEKSNIRILPYDHIHVGETRQSRVETILPPWLRPFYQSLWNTQPDPSEIKPPPPSTPRPRMIHLLPQPQEQVSPTRKREDAG
jgi:protein involved in polysaccharide export with SLBB domain